MMYEGQESAAARERSSEGELVVLIVVEPGLDGVFRHVEGLITFLLSQQVRVHLAYSSRRCGEAMRLLVGKVSASGGEVLDLGVSNHPELRDFVAVARLVRLIRRTRPTVIHNHSSKAGALGRFAALLTRHQHCIYSPHAYFGLAKPPSVRVWFYNYVERLLGKIGLTIAISGDEAQFGARVLKIPNRMIRIVHNPVDTDRFVPATPEERKKGRQILGIPEDAVVLGMIARMCWQKDPVAAYAGVAPICRVNPNLQLSHLGWGKWKGYLLGLSAELGVADQIKIVDYVDDPRTFYHAIDALIVSSRYEAGWPLVFLEAMACNLPIVAATGVGMSDVGMAGLSHIWTFKAEDIAGCTEAVRAWFATEKPQGDACNHRKYAIEHLSPHRCYGAILDLYRNRRRFDSVSPFA